MLVASGGLISDLSAGFYDQSAVKVHIFWVCLLVSTAGLALLFRIARFTGPGFGLLSCFLLGL